VPYLTSVPGVVAATRSVREPLRMMLAGEERTKDAGNEPRYSVIYEIEDPEVLLSPEWAEAGERGRWPTEVRPFTTNRRHVLLMQSWRIRNMNPPPSNQAGGCHIKGSGCRRV
jgi:hypothetical protein